MQPVVLVEHDWHDAEPPPKEPNWHAVHDGDDSLVRAYPEEQAVHVPVDVHSAQLYVFDEQETHKVPFPHEPMEHVKHSPLIGTNPF